MKKQLYLLGLMTLISLVSFGQLKKSVFHVPDSTTNFNANFPDGFIVFDEGSNKLWRVDQRCYGTDNLATVSKTLLANSATAGGDGNGIYDGSGTLSGNTTVTGAGNNLTFTGIQNFSLTSTTNFDLSSSANQMRLTNNGASPISLMANGTGNIELDAVGGSVRMQNLFYPNTDGSAGQAITTDGLGNLSFSTISTNNIYNSDDTTTGKRTVYLIDTLRFDSGYFRVKALNSNGGHKGFSFENKDLELFSIDNTGRHIFGQQTSTDVLNPAGTRFVFLTSASNGNVTFSNAPQDGTNNTTASNINLNFSTRNSAGNVVRTGGFFVRNRNVTPGSEYSVMTINDAIQTENSDGLSGRTVISNQNRHTSGAAAAILEVESRNVGGTETGLLVDHLGTETAIAFGILSPNPTQQWSWRVYNDFSFEHNYSQANSGDAQFRSSTSQNLLFTDASTNSVGINTGTPFSTGAYVLDVNGYAHFGTGTVDIDVGSGGGIFINAGANTNTRNFGVSNSNDGQYFTVTSGGGAGRVGIGLGASNPNTSSILELNSSTHAFLNVRLDTASRNAITAVAGMEAYNTTTNLPTYYNGTEWKDILNIPKIKSGTIDSASFTGTPKTATVTYSTAFSDTLYSPVITCETKNGTTFTAVVESLTAGGFTINMGANDITDLISVRWVAIKNEEN